MCPPDPHARMASYGMRCMRRGIATDAPLTRWERTGVAIGRTCSTMWTAAKQIGVGLLIITGCWSWDRQE